MSNFLLLILSAICSAFFLWKIAPYLFGEKKRGTIYENVLSTLSEQNAERNFQRSLNSTPEKAFLIWLVNFGILFTCLAVSVHLRDPDLFKCLIIYAIVGLVSNGYLRVIKVTQLEGLNFMSRLEIRLFNAWFFPAYAIAAVRKSINSGDR